MSLSPPQAYRKTEFTHRSGLASDRPSASDVLVGTLYFSTDTSVVERSNGITWESYSNEQGAWISPPYSGAYFGSSGSMSWVVDAADVETYAYRLSGKTIEAHVSLVNTTISGTPSDLLRIVVPGGFSMKRKFRGTCINNSATAGAYQLGVWETGISSIILFVYATPAGANWNTGNTHIVGITLVGEVE